MEGIFDSMGWNEDAIGQVESETGQKLEKIESGSQDVAGELTNLRQGLEEKLSGNSAEMRSILELSYDDARDSINTIMMLGDFTKREKARAIAEFAARFPWHVTNAIEDFSLSHEEIVELIEATPDQAHRLQLLEVLRIPGVRGSEKYTDMTSQEIARAIEGALKPEREKDFEKIRLANEVSQELSKALEEAFPERAAREKERTAEEEALNQPVVEVGDLGRRTKTNPQYVNIEGRPLPALYKPRRREIRVREGLDIGDMTGREVLAYAIDRSAGLDVVPTTVLRDGPEGLGIVQDWKVGESAEAVADPMAEKHHAELSKIAVLDFLIRNSDRHGNNWLVSPDGKHRAIDNGMSFSRQKNHFDQGMSYVMDTVKGQALSAEVQAGLRQLTESPQVLAALEKSFKVLLGDEDAGWAWEQFMDRLKQAADPAFRMPPSEYLYGDEETDRQAKLLGYA